MGERGGKRREREREYWEGQGGKKGWKTCREKWKEERERGRVGE